LSDVRGRCEQPCFQSVRTILIVQQTDAASKSQNHSGGRLDAKHFTK